MANYAPRISRDKDGNPIPESNFQASVVATYAKENGTVSSVISTTHDTTALEVAAVGGPAYLRWVRTGDTEASVVSAASGANFQYVIPQNTYRQFVIPIEARATQGASMVGINRGEGLYQRYAIKTGGIASVLVTEYGF